MKCVLNETVTLLQKDEKTNVPLEFDLEHDAEYLKISYSYSPKRLEDEETARRKVLECLLRDAPIDDEEYSVDTEKYLPLLNLVTLSLDDENSYRGAAHRQANVQEHILSKDIASPGFIKGEIKKGMWQIVLNVHALVTEKCVCEIKVEAGGGKYGE